MKQWIRSAAVAMTLAVVAAACGGGGGGGGSDTDTLTPFYDAPIEFDLEAAELSPNGEAAVGADTVQLTDDQVAAARAGGYTAALLWAGAGEWYAALGAGAADRFEELGIEVVATADAQFDPAKQAADVENAMAKDPDIILSLIVDPVSGAAAFQSAVDAGVSIALADNGAEGWTAGNQYVSIATGDHIGMGVAAAELMDDAIGGDGAVGMIYHDADFFVTNNRDNSFRAAIEQRYSDMTIVDSKGFTEEGATYDVAAAMIQQHPEIEGIYVAWDVAAEGVLEALRAAGREDVKVVTHDLGATNGLDMAQGGILHGTVADTPYTLGVTLANLAVLGLLGADAPPFVAVDYIKVTRDNMAEAWQQSLNVALPPELQAALAQ